VKTSTNTWNIAACFFFFPKMRTQEEKEHRLIKNKKDLNGRQIKQLKTLHTHDLVTFISVTAFDVAVYFLIPGFYPSPSLPQQSNLERLAR